MQMKYVVCCYAEQPDTSRELFEEVKFTDEPSYEQIEKVLSGISLSDCVNLEINYNTGAVFSDYNAIPCIYAVVEKRFYGEVE
jgi:hypothetical protein